MTSSDLLPEQGDPADGRQWTLFRFPDAPTAEARNWQVAPPDTYLAKHSRPEVVEVREYPYEDGDTIVLGPQVFVAKDGSVLNWRGENYYRGGFLPNYPGENG